MNDEFDMDYYVIVYFVTPFGKQREEVSGRMRASEAAMTAGMFMQKIDQGKISHVIKAEVVKLRKGI